MHIEFGVQRAERLQRGHHFGQRILHRGGHAQRALEPGVFATGFVDGQLRRFQHAQTAHIKTFARFCQRQPPSVAGEQGDAQFSLQALDGEADHGPGLPQQISRRGQGTGFHHGFESVETIKTDHAKCHLLSKIF